MKVKLKKICITKNEIKREDALEDLDRYMDMVRGELVKNDIKFTESDNCIELETPAEIMIRKPYSYICPYVIYEYIIRFEDPQEKQILKSNIYAVEKDGTTWIEYEHHKIGLSKDWMDKDEVEAYVEVRDGGSWIVMKDVIEELERATENLEKTYTIRVPQWLLKKLRNMDTNIIRDTLEKLVSGYVMVSETDFKNMKRDLESANRNLSDIKLEYDNLKEKYNTVVEFIKEKGLSEEFKQFVEEEQKKQSEEEIKEKYSEIFEED